MTWWQSFFDEDYLHVWAGATPPERTAREVAGLWTLLDLGPGARVLDAACGYGRVARPLAERGACVVGVDQSRELLAVAERERGELSQAELSYRLHDLRHPLDEGGFDVALNLFSSLGYGTEDDDRAILTTLRRALRPGGLVFLDLNHRDVAATLFARGVRPAFHLPDGTVVMEEPRFDAISGRVETAWYWHGPRGGGKKSASIRVYSITELVAMLTSVGFRFRSAHRGCSPEPFVAEGPDLGGRVGLVAEVPSSA
jgi:SAM-dependent methyltransferase